MFTFELARNKDHRLVTTGPYAIVRHPSYTGILFAMWGFVICLTGRNSWLRESGFMETTAGILFVRLWPSVLSLCLGGYATKKRGCVFEERVWSNMGEKG